MQLVGSQTVAEGKLSGYDVLCKNNTIYSTVNYHILPEISSSYEMEVRVKSQVSEGRVWVKSQVSRMVQPKQQDDEFNPSRLLKKQYYLGHKQKIVVISFIYSYINKLPCLNQRSGKAFLKLAGAKLCQTLVWLFIDIIHK